MSRAGVIIASDYSEEESASEFLDMEARRFIQKPYRMHQLLSLVREEFDERKAAEVE